MNEHAGPASALSVLIVGLFAVLLHDRHPSSAQASPRPPSRPQAKAAEPSPEVRDTTRLTGTTSVDPPPEPAIKPAIQKAKVANLAKSAPAQPEKPVAPVNVAPTPALVKTATAPVAPTPARAPFTVVQAGETLVDVATRIYGTPDQAEVLWRANRDQVALIDSKLAPGTLLRTP